MAALPSQPLVWIDCEMTGLDPDEDEILEIYCLVTDGQLQFARRPASPGDPDSSSSSEDPGWGAVVHVDAARLDRMGPWCTAQHGRSGLTAAVRASTVTPEQAADGLLAYVRRFVPEPGVALLAGNSVHADRAFLRRPPYDRVLAHLHYRILDVSSIKEAVRRWAPPAGSGTAAAASASASAVQKPPRKGGAHRAREDILESIAEARYYRDVFFRGRSGEAW